MGVAIRRNPRQKNSPGCLSLPLEGSLDLIWEGWGAEVGLVRGHHQVPPRSRSCRWLLGCQTLVWGDRGIRALRKDPDSHLSTPSISRLDARSFSKESDLRRGVDLFFPQLFSSAAQRKRPPELISPQLRAVPGAGRCPPWPVF